MIGTSLIATLGLLANKAAVVIGAMVVAPLTLPLRDLMIGTLIVDRKLLIRALMTLATEVVIATLLSTGFGLIARGNVLLIVDPFPEEITARLEPTLLNLEMALAAGAIGTYAKANPESVSSVPWPVQLLRWPS